MRQKISKTKYLAVFATTTLIFVIGLIIGNQISSIKLENIDELSENLRIDTMAIELQYLLVAEEPCRTFNSTPLTEELYEIGTKLDYMENRLGNDNPSVLQMKEYYSMLELRHWLFVKKTKKECEINRTSILYFYSNEGDCQTCEEQGYVLSYLHKKYPEMNIYSFDINIDNVALNTIKKAYNVVTTPTLLIDDKNHEGFMSARKIEGLI